MSVDLQGNWDIVVTSLQDICNANETITFNNIYKGVSNSTLQQDIIDHKSNIGTGKRLIKTSQQSLKLIIDKLSEEQAKPATKSIAKKNLHRSSKTSTSKKNVSTRKSGRSFWTSKFNPNEPIVVSSEVAYKLKNRHFEEWIQCEVMKVLGDGNKFEIRDPEPDENNNPGQTFKATYKEILLIPDEDSELLVYPYGTKVLARYPETTTFYPAIVVGTRKDGRVRLKFDGEDEVNKETEVERRLVLPFPDK
ncbi:uncharacterized protein SPAPADRAFT_63808 [Spathaspora passalidarum NRRL Y-27907]|uniref:SGF29 C-terminal domain-containing protein n=1 Tax=Spathaspora passalidarum (strain NRRL Y-27907 / 11-Y1) TaxID=619300 RepID=G3AVN1_SPAPN|nr:uncharacterized protein SPAPADRAFT_63808 [Spathaspora passalidarum NRRL Y-27907]EGW30196.1 hypothetical protein SPAPADRAFT_63808 [Spathaspora passalidarum NRRL Y-27907]